VVLQLGGLGEVVTTPYRKNAYCYGILIQKASEMDWIELAQDIDRWRAVVTAVMNFFIVVSCILEYTLFTNQKIH